MGKKNDAEIISCDSVSFYRGLDIGSAKPSMQERSSVPHYGLDLASIKETLDVRKFHDYAQATVDKLIARDKRILVVGGSGFFFEGFLRPVTDTVLISQDTRRKANEILARSGIRGMLEKLNSYNPDGLGELDVKNPVRVLRALERCMETGKPLHEIIEQFKGKPPPYQAFTKRVIWLDRSDEDLRRRIERRTYQMLKDGMIEETEDALRMGLGEHPSLAASVGYREVIAHLERGGTEDELAQAIIQSTWQLVRKQRKWFRQKFPGQSHYLNLPLNNQRLNSYLGLHTLDLSYYCS